MIGTILPMLPPFLRREISCFQATVARFHEKLEELHLRAHSPSTLTLRGRSIPLLGRLSPSEMERIMARLTDGALYAYRDAVAAGAISLEGGIRVGICGTARYDNGSLVGISNISSLVFRFPSGECDSPEALLDAFLSHTRQGMLIFSPPGVGKTTALRSLCRSLGTRCRVALINERGEFTPSALGGATVDLLSGYHRAEGISMALRSLSPEVIMVDEIGSKEEAAAMAEGLRAGVRFVATVHAGSVEDIPRKENLRPFLSAEIFDCFVGLFRVGGVGRLRVYRREEGVLLPLEEAVCDTLACV